MPRSSNYLLARYIREKCAHPFQNDRCAHFLVWEKTKNKSRNPLSSMGPKKRRRTEEEKAKEAARSKRRRMEETAKKKEAGELLEGMKSDLLRLKEESEEALRKEKLWVKEREELQAKLAETERKLELEKCFWEVRFDSDSFDLGTKGKIAVSLHKAAFLHEEKSGKRQEKESREEREKEVFEKIASCLSTSASTVEGWVGERTRGCTGPSNQASLPVRESKTPGNLCDGEDLETFFDSLGKES